MLQRTCGSPRHVGKREGKGGDSGQTHWGSVLSSYKLDTGRCAGPPSSRMLGGLSGRKGVKDGACRLRLRAWLLPQGYTGSCPGWGPGAREGNANIMKAPFLNT